METPGKVAEPYHAPWRTARRGRYRLRRSVALAVSIGLHALIASLELGDPGLGLPGLTLPWTERRVQAPDLTVRLVEAPRPPTPVPPAAVPPKPPKPAALPRADKSFEVVTPAPPRKPKPKPKPKPLARPLRESGDRAPAAGAPAHKSAIPPQPQQNILALDEALTETFEVPLPTPPEPEPPRAPEVVAQTQVEEETRRKAEEEARRTAEDEARRKAEGERRKEEEAQRLAQEIERRREEEAQRLAQEATEARRKAEEEARRKAEVERRKEAEAQRLAQAAAERERLAAEQARAAAAAASAAAATGASPAPGALSGKELAAKVLGQLRTPGAIPLDPPRPPPPLADVSRRRSILGVERDVVLRMYAESWSTKIERNGPLNYRPSAGMRAPENPLVTVAIRSDGSVEYVHIHRSSGLRELDQAVRRIVEFYAPYSKFPPAIASQYDVIEIRRVWQFDGGLRLMEETR